VEAVPKMRRAMLMIITAIGLLALPAASQAAQTPGPCVPLESQSWWKETPLLPFPGDMQHVHVGACFPYKQVISGNYVLAVTVKMHNEQGRYLTRVRIDDATDQDSDHRYSRQLKYYCGQADCQFVVELVVPTRSLPAGMHEWRVAASTAPRPSNSRSVPEHNLATSGWPVCIRSCSGRTPAVNRTEARGWYRTAPNLFDHQGYVSATWGWSSSHDAEFPWDPGTGTYRPITGVWYPPIWLHSGASDSDVEPVTRSRCWVDPDFHHGITGGIALNQLGPFQGRVAVDTRVWIPNGLHKLVCAAGSSEDGFLDGVFVIPFRVANP
jgi:hypothetical protein